MVIATLISQLNEQIEILKEERPVIEELPAAIAAAVRHGGVVFCGVIGHGMSGDFLNRAGGLAFVRPFQYTFTTNQPVAEKLSKREPTPALNSALGAARLAVVSGNLRSGDFMVLGSVSGRSAAPTEIALACREIGVKVVALTSRKYTAQVKGDHPTGKRLIDCADYVLDLHTPYGDAAVDIPGYDHKLIPFSGMSALVVGWMLWGRVMELMANDAEQPVTFMSVNRENGKAIYDAAIKRFNERGF